MSNMCFGRPRQHSHETPSSGGSLRASDIAGYDRLKMRVERDPKFRSRQGKLRQACRDYEKRHRHRTYHSLPFILRVLETKSVGCGDGRARTWQPPQETVAGGLDIFSAARLAPNRWHAIKEAAPPNPTLLLEETASLGVDRGSGHASPAPVQFLSA